MTGNKLFKTAGWCALAGGLLMLAAFISFPLGAGMFGGILEILGLLVLIFVFYALYVIHRVQSAGLSLAGLILGIAAIVVDVYSMINNGPVFLYNLWYTLLAAPFLIFGYLAYQNARMPRGLAVVALVAGVLFLVSGIGGFVAGTDFADNVSLIPFLLMFVWIFWLWRVFWSKSFADASPTPTVA
jgi:hypothetical protein